MTTILHMIETGGSGGAETVYLDLVRRLDTDRWRHVAVVPTKDWLYDQLSDHGVKPILIPETWSFDVVFFSKMLVAIATHDVELIHAHLFGSAVRAALLSRLSGVPAIATLHGTIDLKPSERFQGMKVKALNFGLKRIVFVSEQLRRSFLDTVPIREDLTTVITNGIDPARFSPRGDQTFRAELDILPEEFLIGTVANPGPAKGLDVLLEAAAILKTRSPGCRFVVLGDLARGRGADVLASRDALGLKRDVVMTGFRNDVPRALSSFDLYALTSRTEGFPLSLLEAMASGLPIVATRCGGPEQILVDGVTGLLVENGSSDAIATAIASLRKNSTERQGLGNAARAVVKEKFTLDAQVRSYEGLYEECLPGGHASMSSRTEHSRPQETRA